MAGVPSMGVELAVAASERIDKVFEVVREIEVVGV